MRDRQLQQGAGSGPDLAVCVRTVPSLTRTAIFAGMARVLAGVVVVESHDHAQQLLDVGAVDPVGDKWGGHDGAVE